MNLSGDGFARAEQIGRRLRVRLKGSFATGTEGRESRRPFQHRRFRHVEGCVCIREDLQVPVIVGASEGERKFLGVRQIATLVRELREEFDFPIFLNADHTHSLAGAVEAAKAGFDSVVFDLSALPMEQNIRQTKEAIGVLKGIYPAMLIEGEIGDIGTGSEIHDVAPDLSKKITSPEEAKRYVDATGVDILAPAVGNMHGMVASMIEGKTRKHLDIARIAQIKSSTGSLMTLHGASGTDDEDLRKAIAAGINVVRIDKHRSTSCLEAWSGGRPDQTAQ